MNCTCPGCGKRFRRRDEDDITVLRHGIRWHKACLDGLVDLVTNNQFGPTYDGEP